MISIWVITGSLGRSWHVFLYATAILLWCELFPNSTSQVIQSAFFLPDRSSSQFRSGADHHTPLKINMEMESRNHPIEKETHLPSLTLASSRENFPGVQQDVNLLGCP